jgi:hypothetical protein
MTYGATAAPVPNPRANASLAVGCATCNGWGSVITPHGHHELCLTCQPNAVDGPAAPAPSPATADSPNEVLAPKGP